MQWHVNKRQKKDQNVSFYLYGIESRLKLF